MEEDDDAFDAWEAARELQGIADALQSPVRRDLLALLDVGGTTAGDLAASAAAIHGISVSRASEHLQVLARAGLVDVLPQGPRRWYAIIDGGARPLVRWLGGRRLA